MTGTSQVRLGYFPNITHAQPNIGLKRGVYQKHLGAAVHLNPKIFNAGPPAIEALLAGELDLLYVGPSPALNGYLRSDGQALKVIAGAASGGAVFVARGDVLLERKEDFAGKRIASPQIGNTQDISLRSYLKQMGLAPKERGGSVEILPIANPDILSLFLRKEIDAAWVPEPWGSILVRNANARIVLDERDLWPNHRFATTVLVAARSFLERSPELVRRFLKAHVETTQWIQQNRQEAQNILNQEIARLTRKLLPDKVVNDAMSRVDLTWDPITPSIQIFFERSVELRYSRGGDTSGLYDLRPLNQVLQEGGLRKISVGN
jgi:NitT/TauT family transport system substrate-binding protein